MCLTNLKTLDISGVCACKHVGNISLSLVFNKGNAIPSLPSTIKQMSKLEEVNFAYNALETVPQTIAQLKVESRARC